MFCPKCGKLMLPKKKNGKTIMVCIGCGYTSEKMPEIIKEKVKAKKEIDIIENEEAENVHPIDSNAVCPKCGNKGAYYWEIQTRAGDEAATKFFKCTKCKHTWRDYN